MKHSIIHNYNKYMGGVDSNDQLLKYSAFSRRTVKWWKKVFFRILNLSIVNAYVMFLEWKKAKGIKYKGTQTYFRVKLIQCMIESVELQPPTQRRLSSNALTHQRLSGRHFIQKIQPNNGQKRPISRSCVVCGPAERQLLKHVGEKRKRPGRESSYECVECGVTLCVDPCLMIYHNYTDFVKKYISMKTPLRSRNIYLINFLGLVSVSDFLILQLCY